MKVSREQIERLRDHAGVSYEDAQAALEASGGDQLDALVWLEQAGKIPSSGVHSCTSGAWSEPEPGRPAGKRLPALSRSLTGPASCGSGWWTTGWRPTAGITGLGCWSAPLQCWRR